MLVFRNVWIVLLALGALATAPVRAQIVDAPSHLTTDEIKAYRVAGDHAYRTGDYAEAMRQYMPAAEAGDAIAQNDIATMYQDGEGVTPDYALAAEWYQLAADQGLATAENTLGVMYAQGQGVTPDRDKALDLYRRAATHGDAYAQANLGMRYLEGDGVPKDYSLAVSWLTRSADQGYAGADLELGYLYRDGRGVTQDDYQAYIWFNRTLRDIPKTYYERDRVKFQQAATMAKAEVARKLTPKQIKKADKA